jgi:methionyl-tRNA formyltransferase
MKIQILIDNPNSWVIPYAEKLVSLLKEMGHNVFLIYKHSDVVSGDILCLLSCEKIFNSLGMNRHNLVVHESDLPQGKGWSPLTWQILEGQNIIPITLFEASEVVDSGPVYFKDHIVLKGNELIGEIRQKQGDATIDLIVKFIKSLPEVEGFEQKGDESFYPKRTIIDSKLDLEKSLNDQFNLLRVCDNERYPAWFEYKGRKYIIKIFAE